MWDDRTGVVSISTGDNRQGQETANFDAVQDIATGRLARFTTEGLCGRLCAGHYQTVQPVTADIEFPKRFKSAQVLPLLKKAGLDRSSPANYRPISNLSTVSKVLERLVLARLRPHLTNSTNFSKWQSAYRQGHSTETTLLDVLENVYAAADDKEVTVFIG